MRKLLVILTVALVAVWLIMWLGASAMSRFYATDADRPWPMGLGTLADARTRYPPAPASPAAYALVARAAKLGISIAPRGENLQPEESANTRSNPQLRRAIQEYLASQITKVSATIDAPPEAVATYLAAHAADLAEVRAVALGEEQIAWAVDYPSRTAPIPNLLGHQVLARTLLTNALDRARRNEPGAWDDAQAVVRLTSNLWSRPELISALIALNMSRTANAVMRKLPLPAPRWYEGFRRFDYTKAMLASRQAETSVMADAIEAEISFDEDPTAGPFERVLSRIGQTVTAPYVRLSAADGLEIDRQLTATIVANRSCTMDASAISQERMARTAWWNYPARQITMSNLDASWQRLFRFRAELEATDRALAFRGRQPPMTASVCEGAEWIYSAKGFRFSKQIPLPSPAVAVPLEFVIPSREDGEESGQG